MQFSSRDCGLTLYLGIPKGGRKPDTISRFPPTNPEGNAITLKAASFNTAKPVSDGTDLTLLLQRIQDGDEQAIEELIPKIHARLQSMARRYLQKGRSPTYGTEDLLGDFHKRLFVDYKHVTFENRRHFFKYAGMVMQTVWAKHWEKKNAGIREGHLERVPLADALESADTDQSVRWTDVDHLSLKQAMDELERHDPLLREVLLHIYYHETPVKEIAEIMGLSPRTIRRKRAQGLTWLEKHAFAARERKP